MPSGGLAILPLYGLAEAGGLRPTASANQNPRKGLGEGIRGRGQESATPAPNSCLFPGGLGFKRHRNEQVVPALAAAQAGRVAQEAG
jgi:hypothetical protein